MLDVLSEKKTLCTVQSYCSEQFIVGNETDKPSDDPSTDQEHKPGDRADQTHRVQLSAKSISFASPSTALSLVKSVFVFVYCSFEKLYSNVVYSCHSNDMYVQSISLLAPATFVRECTSYPIVSHESEYGTFLNEKKNIFFKPSKKRHVTTSKQAGRLE